MADRPTDLRTLAELVARTRAARWRYTETLDPDELARFIAREADDTNLLADLAAVLPAHRALVLAEASDELDRRDREVPWSDPGLRRGIQYASAVVSTMGRLAATSPTDGPAPRQSDEQPQVPTVPPNDPPEAHSGSQGVAVPRLPEPRALAWAEATGVVAADAWRIEQRRLALADSDDPDCGHDLDAYQRQVDALRRVRDLAARAAGYDFDLVPDQIYAALDGTEEDL